MKEKWTWMDYKMEGPPPIVFEDWTINAYGRETEINELVERIKYYSERGARQLLRLIAWWGSGKSTFLYNACYRINDRLFFGDEIEKPEEESYRHVLALYLKGPVKRREFLEYTLENGLPVPWGLNLSRDEAAKKRRELWYECIRKLTFILLRKALSEISRQHLEGEAISGSAFLKDLYEKVFEFRNLKTSDFIKKIDELYAKDARVFDELGELLRYYIRILMYPIEERVGRTKVVSQEDFEIEFPKLLYPYTSGSFLSSYRKLFGSPDTNLRRFTAFEKILKYTSTFAFVVIDEVEDWSKITKDRIDFDLHDIVTDAESPISMVLIFRTEALRGVRSAPSLERYMTIVDRFTDISLKELSLKEIEELTAGILSSTRKGEMDIFPCTPDFIAELAKRSKRVETFNIRQYIRSLTAILEKSLNWQRKDVCLTKDLLDLTEAKEVIAGIVREEEQRAKIFKPPEVEE
jgi:hypothetical protein